MILLPYKATRLLANLTRIVSNNQKTIVFQQFYSSSRRLAQELSQWLFNTGSTSFLLHFSSLSVWLHDDACKRFRDIILGRGVSSFRVSLYFQSVCLVLNRVQRAGGDRRRAPLITPDIRNFHNLFQLWASLVPFAPSHPRTFSSADIGGAYSLQASASRRTHASALTPVVPFVN